MNSEPENRQHGAAGVVFALILIVSMGYVTLAALQGEYGLLNLMRVEAREELMRQQLAELRADRATIANKTTRLSTEHLDLELLDERARKVLGLARPDEIVIR